MKVSGLTIQSRELGYRRVQGRHCLQRVLNRRQETNLCSIRIEGRLLIIQFDSLGVKIDGLRPVVCRKSLVTLILERHSLLLHGWHRKATTFGGEGGANGRWYSDKT